MEYQGQDVAADVLRLIGRSWLTMLFRGLIAAILGIVIFFQPKVLQALVVVFFLLYGAFEISLALIVKIFSKGFRASSREE